jgi:hypothetical protein
MVKYNFRRHGLKRKILFSLLSLVLVMSLVIPMGCMPKRDATTPTTDAERIAALESKVNQLQSKIASLPESDSTDYSGDINALYDEIDNLSMELDDILAEVDDMLAAWEEEQASFDNGSSSSNSLDTTKWSLEVEFANDLPAGVTLEYEIKPTRIEESDTYRVNIFLYSAGATIENNYITVYFVPRDKDTNIDTKGTFLDSANSPYLDWYPSFSPKESSGVSSNCRRITFESDEFDLTLTGNYTIKLDFDLYYAE